jgi:hypothetical protein
MDWPTGLALAVVLAWFFYQNHEITRRYASVSEALSNRIEELEAFVKDKDRQFRNALRRFSPPPLEQVMYLSFAWTEQFWNETLATTKEEREFVAKQDSFVYKVVLECWRGHRVVDLHFRRSFLETFRGFAQAEGLLPLARAYPGPAEHLIRRVLDSDGLFRPVILWSLPLKDFKIDEVSEHGFLELLLHEDHLLFCAVHGRFGGRDYEDHTKPKEDNVFFKIPLNFGELRKLGKRLESKSADRTAQEIEPRDEPTVLDLSCEDNEKGISWGLTAHDLVAWHNH